MFCDKCGKETPDDAKFCIQCGAAVKNVDVDEVPNTGSEQNEKPQQKRKRKITMDAIVFAIMGVVLIIMALYIYHSKVGVFKGTWELMSGNETSEVEAGSVMIPSYIEIGRWGRATLDGYSGEYDIDRKNEVISFNAGPYCYSYDYIIKEHMLYLMEHGSEKGEGDVGIYLNYDKASDEQQEYYDYAVSIYDYINGDDYLEGHWSGVLESGFTKDSYDKYMQSEALFGYPFSMYESDDGTHISLGLERPDYPEGSSYEISGNLIKVGGLNVIRFIPISDDTAYFFSYADSSLHELLHIDE